MNKNESIKLFKLISGEEFIATILSDKVGGDILVKDAVSITYHPTQDGKMTSGFAPFMPLGSDEVEIKRSAIAAAAEPKGDVIREYERVFSKLALPPTSKLSIVT